MKSFRFTLQRPLDAKLAKEKAAEVRLGKAMQRLDKAKKAVAQLRARRETLVSQIDSIIEGNPSWKGEFKVQMLYLTSIDEQLGEREQVVDRRASEVASAREALAELVMIRKVYENLKQREKKAWLLQKKSFEEKEMDEIASMGFLRRETA